MITPCLHPESTLLPSHNHGAFTEKGNDVPGASIPSIVISRCDIPSEPPEEEELQSAANSDSSNENCSQDKPEDSDNPLTSHFKMIFKGLTRSRSQESLVSTKSTGEDDPPDSYSTPHCSQNGGVHGEGAEGPSWLHFSARSYKKEKTCLKMSGGAHKVKVRDQGTGEDSQCQRSQVNWEQLEATKAIFDLLKEISGLLSILTVVHNIKSFRIIAVFFSVVGSSGERSIKIL